MESCQFDQINMEPLKTWRPLLRQALVGSGVWASYFQTGLWLGAPTVLVPQLRRQHNHSDTLSADTASWISSTSNYCSIPWAIMLPILAHLAGRRFSFTLVSVCSLAGFITILCSTTVSHILAGAVIHGVLFACQKTVCLMIITEYAAPEYRGIFLTIKTATVFWGIWAANAIGTFAHWKNIAKLGIACAAYSLLVVAAWPESPYWLAGRDRLAACRQAHRWLRGTNELSEKELQTLISTQNRERVSENKRLASIITTALEDMRSTKFYKPMLLSLVLLIMYQCTGKMPLVIYAIDVIKKMTGSESAAYSGMLILDGVTVLGMYGGCILSRYLTRRTLLFAAESIGITFLLILSLYLYLIKLNIVAENVYLSIFLLMAFSMAVSCGPILLATAIAGELIPLKCRGVYLVVLCAVFEGCLATNIKLTPWLYGACGLHGAFLAYAVSSLVCFYIVFKYLPETKDKTLQEIEDCFERRSKSPSVEK